MTPVNFVDELAQLSWAWHDNSMFDDINEKLEHFNHNFLEVLNRHSPIKSMRIRYRRCPFIDHEIKELMDARDRLHKCARLTYIWTGKYIVCLETKSRTSYVTQRRNIFRMRSTTRRGTQRGKQSGTVFQPVYTRDMKNLAEEFNEFFTSVGARAAEAAKKLAIDRERSSLTDTSNCSYSSYRS